MCKEDGIHTFKTKKKDPIPYTPPFSTSSFQGLKFYTRKKYFLYRVLCNDLRTGSANALQVLGLAKFPTGQCS